jgi:molecular chaperone GrpE
VTEERSQEIEGGIEEKGPKIKGAAQEQGPAETTGEEQPGVDGESRPPAAEGEQPEAVDVVATIRQELEQARAKEAEYLDGWQRARAELSNARKRFQRDQEQAYTNGKADLLARLLSIVDDFDRAFETLPEDLSLAGLEPASLSWLEGVQLIQRKLQLLLEQERVAPIEAAGRAFDPFLHQAITHEPSEEVPEGHVIAEMQRGYVVGDRVLRPSVVRVSSGPLVQSEPEAEREPADSESPPGEEAQQ